MNKQAQLMGVLLGALFFLQIPSGLCFTLQAPESSEELLLSPPATVHSFKNPRDLHNLAVGILSITELEFIKIGDSLVSLPLRGSYHPLRNTADIIRDSFYRIPQKKPVRRVGQLFDALQLRQMSLSDARFVSVAANGEIGSGVSPIMQTRINKLLILVEDLLDDVDPLILYPVNQSLALKTHSPSQVRLLGYAGDGLGFLRRKLFTGLRIVSKTLVKSSSRMITGVEALRNRRIRHKRMKEYGDYMIFLKMPAEIYAKHQSYFESGEKRFFAADISTWTQLAEEGLLNLKELLKGKTQKSISDNLPSGPVLLAIEISSWQDPPQELLPYVITQEELRPLLNVT